MTSESLPQSGARDRAYALQAVRVPAMRAAGFAFMLVALVIHNALLDGLAAAKVAIPWTLILAGYTAISFVVLRAYYRHPDREGKNGVGWIFLLGDAIFIAALVFISGADRSWLFPILLMPVLTHGQFSAKRSVLQTAWITTTYFAMLLYTQFVADFIVNWPVGIAKGLLLVTISGYCVLIAVIAENNRKRIAAALREAKAQAESRATHLAALNRLTQMAAGVLDLDAMLATVTKEMVTLFRASSSGIALMDDERRVLRVVAHHSVTPQQGVVGTEIPLSGNPSAEYVVESGRPLVINDVQQTELTAPMHPVMRRLGIHAMLLAPLRSYGEVIGTIGIDTDDPDRTFTAEEIELAETIAGEISGPVGNARLYASLQESNKLLADLSRRDALTGVANRRKFEETLDSEWQRARRAGTPIALLMIDVDCFKSYNDTHGHQEGDEVLRRVAGSLRDGIRRAGDLVARFGGEEFAVLLPSTDLAHALQIAEMLRASVEALALPHAGSPSGVVTISLGAASMIPADEDLAELIARADAQLYEAKRGGRNRVGVGARGALLRAASPRS